MDLVSIPVGIGTGVVAAGISFVAGRSYQSFVQTKVDKRYRRFTALMPFDFRKAAPLVLTYGCIPHAPERKARYIVEQGDVTALMRASQLGARLFGERRVLVTAGHDLLPTLELHRNVMSISGPKWNRVTARLLAALGSPIDFSTDGHALLVYSGQQERAEAEPERYETVRQPNQLATVCHALLVVGERNVPDQDGRQRVLIAAGRTTLSTHGALLYLSLLANSKQRQEQLAERGVTGGERWAALLRFDRNETPSPDLTMQPLQEGAVQISLLRTFTTTDFRQPYRPVEVGGLENRESAEP